MTTFTNQTKGGERTYLVSEAGDFYLIGSAEDETLITQEETTFTNQTKNSTTFTNQTKN